MQFSVLYPKQLYTALGSWRQVWCGHELSTVGRLCRLWHVHRFHWCWYWFGQPCLQAKLNQPAVYNWCALQHITCWQSRVLQHKAFTFRIQPGQHASGQQTLQHTASAPLTAFVITGRHWQAMQITISCNWPASSLTMHARCLMLYHSHHRAPCGMETDMLHVQ